MFVDLEFSSHGASFIVGNSGSTPATQITFEVDDKVPWVPIGGARRSLADLPVVKHGISYLAPNRTLKYMGAYPPREQASYTGENVLIVKLHYQGESGRQYERLCTIGFGQYAGVLYESFTNPAAAVAEAIRDAESSRRSAESMDRTVSRLVGNRRRCPACGEAIGYSAKKCPHCLETFGPLRGRKRR